MKRCGEARPGRRAFRLLASLELDHVLKLMQSVEFLLRQLLLVVLRVSEVFLRVLDLLTELVGAEILKRDSGFGEQDKTRFTRVGKTPAHEYATVLAFGVVDSDDSGAHRGHDRRVVAEHLEVALGAGNEHRLSGAVEEHLVRRHELEMESRRHSFPRRGSD